MANEIRFVIEQKEDGTWKGFKALTEHLKTVSSGRWVLALRKYRKSRTTQQNGYYWGCVIPAVIDGLLDMGFDRNALTSESVHELLKSKFLKYEIEGELSGEFITMTKSTSDHSTTEFNDYIADIQQWSAEFLGIIIADPGEQTQLEV